MPRQHERIDFRVQIELQSASGRYEAYLSDLSQTGCYVDSRVEVGDGQDVSFDLVHPNGGRLAFTGKIVHNTPGVGFGLNFTDVTDEQSLFLKRMIR
jgi:hypothetical protein